ncbi:MAG: hypothetical protein JNK05_08585 [Myxococcales bacterium]|nr:hypothetical protein [Myxococcales bacterium]
MKQNALACIAFALPALVACRDSGTPNREHTSAATAASGAGSAAPEDAQANDVTIIQDAGVAIDPVEAARSRFSAAHAARWPTAGGFDYVIALLRPEPRGTNQSYTWVRAAETSLVEARSFPLNATSVSGISAMDLGGEPGEESLVFGEGLNQFSTTVAVFSLPPGRDQPMDDGARSAALDGAHTLDEARARLPFERARTDAERSAMSNTAMLGQLVFAAPAELRAMVAPRGLEACRVSAPQGQRRTQRCRTYAGRALTDRVLESELRQQARTLFDQLTTMTFQCATAPEQSCTAGRSGGTELTFFIAGAGAARRITKVTLVDHEIGE